MNVVSLFLYLYSIGRQHALYESQHSIYVEFHPSSVFSLLSSASNLLVWGLQHIFRSATHLSTYSTDCVERERECWKDIFWLIVIFISSYIIYPAYKLNCGYVCTVYQRVCCVCIYAILSSSDVVSNIMIISIVSKMFTEGIIISTWLKYDHVWSFLFCLWRFPFSSLTYPMLTLLTSPGWMPQGSISVDKNNLKASLHAYPCSRIRVSWVESVSI